MSQQGDIHGESISLRENFEDLFEHSLSGQLILDPHGEILRGNSRLAGWLGCRPGDLKSLRFSSLLSVGGRIYYETHLAPLLRMQGFFDEVSLELKCADGQRFKVLANAIERRDDSTQEPLFIRVTLYKASDRHAYELNLRESKTLAENALLTERDASLLREQFIAILGHDLRNPLSAVLMGTWLLSDANLDPRHAVLVETMRSSATRMDELIKNVMDLARGRLGGGMVLNLQPSDLGRILEEVVGELQTSHPARQIVTLVDLPAPVVCDSGRISQLVSNLLANALTHGSPYDPIFLSAEISEGNLEISVSNSGKAISPEALPTLFEPFTREDVRSSQNGLGLGLYIVAEVAKAHGGSMAVTSIDGETRFTFTMGLALASLATASI